MPSTSQAQQRLMAMAEHNPSAVYGRNRGVLQMTQQQLHDFAATKRKGLPKKKTTMGAMMRQKEYSNG